MDDRDHTEPERLRSLRKHRKPLLLGLACVAVAATAVVWTHRHQTPETAHTVATSPSPADAQHALAGPANFRGEDPMPDARLVANWVFATHDNGKHAAIIVDKKDARVYVLTPEGQLADSAPALLGASSGDAIVPGSGDKTPAQMTPEEKTTPAGRFVAEPGTNASDEDVIWVDYDAAISMHRVRPNVARERRLERLATLSTEDNRVSFGCINLPVTFYEDVVKPTVTKYGAVIYVLPEMKTVQQVFGAYDVTDPAQVAAARQREATLADAARKANPAPPTAQG